MNKNKKKVSFKGSEFESIKALATHLDLSPRTVARRCNNYNKDVFYKGYTDDDFKWISL